MDTRQRFRYIAVFLAGALAALVLVFGVLQVRSAQASISIFTHCYGEPLNFKRLNCTPNMDSPSLLYSIPDCLSNAGYRAASASIAGDGSVAVTYQK